MALANPFHIPNTLGKSVTGKAPKPLANPWHVPNTLGQDITGTPPVYGAAPAPVAAAAPAPPPPDFDALTKADAGYTQGISDINRQNQYTLEDLLKGYLGRSQGYQDNANAHGALFSGAAVNAQNSAADAYKQAGERQAAGVLSQKNNLYNNVFQRLIQQLAGGQ